MKIDRLIGILSVLLQQDKTTAPELAEKFEVSRRTIHRDIEALCKAGIPICTIQGSGGGIRIMEGYRVDRTLLSSKDMQMVLAGLRSLDSVSGSSYYGQLMEKLKPGASDFVSGRDYILIDLSSWYKESLAPKISEIQNAIEERRLLSFYYYAPAGESFRRIEPYYLIFKWSSWYVWGWCLKKQDYRMFKLNRMDGLKKEPIGFEAREGPLPDLSNERIFPGRIRVKALFQPETKWRLIEEFSVQSFKQLEDGTLLFQMDYTDEDNLVRWLLSFGEKVKVLEPKSVRDKLLETARQVLRVHEEENGKQICHK